MPSWLPARAQVGAAMASCWRETKGMAGQPCPPTKLKYLAVIVMSAASTVLAKSVRFLEHVSPGLTVRLAVSEIKPVQSLTDRQTDRQTELSTTVTLAAHAREG